MISRQRSAASVFCFALLGMSVLTVPTGRCITEPLKRNNGVLCALDGDCVSGNCVDGVCCDTECSGICQACTAAKKGSGDDGICASVDVGLDPDDECANAECSGANKCGIALGALCTTATDCGSQHCIGGICCDTECSGSREACNLGGSVGTCVMQTPSNCTDGVELTDVTVYSTSKELSSIVLGDFNGDGQQDVGMRHWDATYQVPATYAVAHGQGNGTIGPAMPATKADWISFVTAAADTNHNGFIEIDEQFVDSWELWADFTNDGIIDLISESIDYGQIGIGQMDWEPTTYWMDVYVGNADGTLTFSNAYSFSSISPNAPGSNAVPPFAAADFNGDAHLDVAIGGYNHAAIRLGQGDGTFTWANVTWTQGMALTNGIYATDLNQDSHSDVVVAWNEGQIIGHLGKGDGTFSSQSLTISSTGPSFGLRLTDIDKDGNVDLLEPGGLGLLQVRLGNGDGTFGIGKGFATGAYFSRIHVADMDNDGRNDVVTLNGLPDGFSVLLNRCVP